MKIEELIVVINKLEKLGGRAFYTTIILCPVMPPNVFFFCAHCSVPEFGFRHCLFEK